MCGDYDSSSYVKHKHNTEIWITPFVLRYLREELGLWYRVKFFKEIKCKNKKGNLLIDAVYHASVVPGPARRDVAPVKGDASYRKQDVNQAFRMKVQEEKSPTFARI